MAVGVEVVSAYSGPASVNSFEDVNKVSETKTHKIEYSESDLALYALYQQVRGMREKDNVKEEEIVKIFNQLKENFPNDWLLMLELYEISVQKGYSIKDGLKATLLKLKCNKSYTTLIENGLVLCEQKM